MALCLPRRDKPRLRRLLLQQSYCHCDPLLQASAPQVQLHMLSH